MARFIGSRVFRTEVFSLGRDSETDAHYLSTPIAGTTHAVDVEAYFRVTEDEYRLFARDPVAARSFVDACRMGKLCDRRLA